MAGPARRLLGEALGASSNLPRPADGEAPLGDGEDAKLQRGVEEALEHAGVQPAIPEERGSSSSR